jgi:hypothetical protein
MYSVFQSPQYLVQYVLIDQMPTLDASKPQRQIANYERSLRVKHCNIAKNSSHFHNNVQDGTDRP